MTKKNNRREAYVELGNALSDVVPQLFALWNNDEEFVSLHFKMRIDGTILAVVKCYGSDGTPMVCFGSGYGITGALMGAEASVAGNHWKVDKPWSGETK